MKFSQFNLLKHKRNNAKDKATIPVQLPKSGDKQNGPGSWAGASFKTGGSRSHVTSKTVPSDWEAIEAELLRRRLIKADVGLRNNDADRAVAVGDVIRKVALLKTPLNYDEPEETSIWQQRKWLNVSLEAIEFARIQQVVLEETDDAPRDPPPEVEIDDGDATQRLGVRGSNVLTGSREERTREPYDLDQLRDLNDFQDSQDHEDESHSAPQATSTNEGTETEKETSIEGVTSIEEVDEEEDEEYQDYQNQRIAQHLSSAEDDLSVSSMEFLVNWLTCSELDDPADPSDMKDLIVKRKKPTLADSLSSSRKEKKSSRINDNSGLSFKNGDENKERAIHRTNQGRGLSKSGLDIKNGAGSHERVHRSHERGGQSIKKNRQDPQVTHHKYPLHRGRTDDIKEQDRSVGITKIIPVNGKDCRPVRLILPHEMSGGSSPRKEKFPPHYHHQHLVRRRSDSVSRKNDRSDSIINQSGSVIKNLEGRRPVHLLHPAEERRPSRMASPQVLHHNQHSRRDRSRSDSFQQEQRTDTSRSRHHGSRNNDRSRNDSLEREQRTSTSRLRQHYHSRKQRDDHW